MCRVRGAPPLFLNGWCVGRAVCAAALGCLSCASGVSVCRFVWSGVGGGENFGLVTKLRDAYRDLTRKRGEEVRIEHVKSHTGVRGNEAADKLAALGAQIQDGHRIVERNSREPQMLDAEYKDNG